jgi:hypothetical protein
MLLPRSKHFPKEPGLNWQPPTKTKTKSYAQAVKADTRVSLMHGSVKKPHQDDPSQKKTLHSKIFRTSRTKGALLFDLSRCKEKYTDLQCMMLLREQHPNVNACVLLNDGPRRYLEAYISDDEDDNKIAKNGLEFKELNLLVYPCKALSDTAKIINVKLTHLPLLPRDAVLAGLTKSLKVFGNILDLGIITEPNTGFFMGSGYAVLVWSNVTINVKGSRNY